MKEQLSQSEAELLKRPITYVHLPSAKKDRSSSWFVIGVSILACFGIVMFFVLDILYPPIMHPAVNGRLLPVPGVKPAVLVAGRHVFLKEKCAECHNLDTTVPYDISKTFAPDLTQEGQRHPSIAWQTENLTHHDKLYPNSMMPNYTDLSPHNLKALASFLATRK